MRGMAERRGVILAPVLSHRTKEAEVAGCRLVGECAEHRRKGGNWGVTGGSLVVIFALEGHLKISSKKVQITA